jgi:hypothetical protein
MKPLNKRAALLTLLTMGVLIATIVAVVIICLYVPTVYIMSSTCVLMFIGIIITIYRSFCDDPGFKK